MDYRQEGQFLEREFINSWEWPLQYFAMLFENWGKNDRALQFMSELRRRYDRKLRAGISLEFFILSRSRVYGLREDQLRVAFLFRGEVMNVYEQQKVVLKTEISLSPEVQVILTRLENAGFGCGRV